MKIISINKGTQIYLGAPASPFPDTVVNPISTFLTLLPGVLEAHIPQCYIQETMDKPAQILVVVLKKGMEHNTIEELNKNLPALLPNGMEIDLWPLPPNHYLLSTIREAKCVLKDPLVQKKWWHIF